MDTKELISINEYSDDEIKAAYALNYCTVSVSQIIDYKDINILEQEYEAILNNLNLEIIPKDEALLNILKQLLDTITFFRISEVEKSFIDREYQHQVQNAIWAAAPQFGMCIATGHPLAIAASFLSQVGIGYMNYRNNMDNYVLEKDKKLWQLQRTAIEQFNGLRRELFDTAWRMTSDHSMHDVLRLTENQINQLNTILKDGDIQRRFERLNTIKEYFIAYPPFWYYMGSAAYYLYSSETVIYCDEDIEQEQREYYRLEAKRCFETYREITKDRSILREDTISAACALEHADLLIAEKNENNNKQIADLLSEAEVKSGYAFDVMEMCAIEYLKINDMESASRLLRRLVNEDYNTIINAQLLSSIYVRTKKISEYKLLKSRVPEEYLYEMPAEEEYTEAMIEASGKDFADKQREILKMRYQEALYELVEKYSIEWNKFTSTFDMEEEYPEGFFASGGISLTKRIIEARRVFADDYKKTVYLERMSENGIELTLVDDLNSFTKEVFSLGILSDTNIQQEFVDSVEQARASLESTLEQITMTIESKEKFNDSLYADMQKKISFTAFVKDSVDNVLIKYIDSILDELSMDDFSEKEEELRTFCRASMLEEPTIVTNSIVENAGIIFDADEKFFEAGNTQKRAVKNRKFIEQMETGAKDELKKHSFVTDPAHVDIIFRSDKSFDEYFGQLKFEDYPSLRPHTFMVLRDNRKLSMDFAFTTEGIVSIYFGKPKQKCTYKEVYYNKRSKQIHFAGLLRYSRAGINTEVMYKFIKFLDKRFINDLDLRTKYFSEDTVVTFSEIYKWLQETGREIDEKHKCVIAYPDTKTLYNLGYRLSREYSKESNLLQFFYDEETGSVEDLHIISFAKIETSFQQQIEEHDGFMVIE